MNRGEGLDRQRLGPWKGIEKWIGAIIRLVPAPGWWTTVALLGLLAYTGSGYARNLTSINLIVDGEPRRVRTQRATVGALLADLGFDLEPWDRVTPERDEALENNTTVIIQHARQVTVVADGVTRTLYTHSNAIDEILDQAGLTLEAPDKLWVNHTLVSALPPAAPPELPAWRTASSRGAPDAGPITISHIQIERAIPVHLHDGSIEQTLRTTARTVGQTLLQAGTLLYLGDFVHPDLNAPLSAGVHIYIRRSKPIYIQADEHTLYRRTHAPTVEHALAEAGVALLGLDFVTPPPDTPIVAGLHIRVTRVTEKTIIEQQEIPFETKWLADNSLELDQKRIDHVGENGIDRRRYRVVYHDGRQVECYLQDEWTAKEPQARQIAYGTKIVVRTLETPEGELEYWRRLRVFLTSYTAATCGKNPGDPWYGKTRIGWDMRRGIIAVDPRVIPMLTEMYVPGYGRGVAADTGGMIKGMHIDLGHEIDNFTMYYWWGYVYLMTPVPPAYEIRWILPDFPRER